MDWTKVLRSLQSDFLKRLSSGNLLHTQKQGEHSELTIISGERLRQLRDFCWRMAEKYKRAGTVRDVFISNLKGKLGEEVIKERLSDFITEIDYETKLGGDGGIDFTLTSDINFGIEVKSRCGFFNKVKWSLSVDEVNKNKVVACVLIQEDVNEAQSEYHLIFAGFLPTQMIKLKTGKIYFGIEQLLYGGGLRFFLEENQSGIIQDNSLSFSQGRREGRNHHRKNQENYSDTDIYKDVSQDFHKSYFPEQSLSKNRENITQINQYLYQQKNIYSQKKSEEYYIKLIDKYLDRKEYTIAVEYCGKIIDESISSQYNLKGYLQKDNVRNKLYYKRAFARYELANYQGTIEDCNLLISINPNHALAYRLAAKAYAKLGQHQQAIFNYNQVIRLNPYDDIAYRNRADARYDLGDKQGAIEDYAKAIRINPHDNYTYRNLDGNSDVILESEHLFKDNILSTGQTKDASQNQQEEGYDSDAYKKRGKNRYDLGDYIGAIEDYTKAIDLNSQNNFQDSEVYHLRADAHYDLGNTLEAIENYTQAINIDSQDVAAYYQRACGWYDLADRESITNPENLHKAIADFKIAAEIYKKQGNVDKHQEVRERILELEIEESLDILDF